MYVMDYRKPRHPRVSSTLNCVSKAYKHGPNPGCVLDTTAHHSYVTHIRSGYRKNDTGEYVANKYYEVSRGKGAYYQPATTVIHLGLADALVLGAIRVESLDADTVGPYELDWQQAHHISLSSGIVREAIAGLDSVKTALMFYPLWSAANPEEAAATLLLTSKYELSLARAVLEHRITI